MTGMLDKCKDHGTFKCTVPSCYFYHEKETGQMFHKIVPGRSKKYMSFVREQPCCLTGMEGNDNHGIDPHHEALPGHGTMGGKPCDSRCIPIAHLLHCKMEDAGSSRKEVFAEYGIDPEEVIIEMKGLWLSRGNKQFWS